MPSMFTVVSWLPVPLIQQVTGPRATTVNIALTVEACLSTKTYFVGAQKNRLNEAVLLSSQNTCLEWT